MTGTQTAAEAQPAINVVQQFFEAVDARAWAEVESLMCDPLALDYSSYGGPAAAMAPRDIIESWRQILPGYDATHHQIGAVSISMSVDDALCQAHGTASHFMANEGGTAVWTVYGRYRIALRREAMRWRLSALTFLFMAQAGDASLPNRAVQRAATPGS